MRMDSKTYLNAILTAIALLLLVTALQRPAGPVDLATPAYGQPPVGGQSEARYLSSTGAAQRSVDATEKIAEANLEIARQVGEVAKALDEVARSIRLAATPRQ